MWGNGGVGVVLGGFRLGLAVLFLGFNCGKTAHFENLLNDPAQLS